MKTKIMITALGIAGLAACASVETTDTSESAEAEERPYTVLGPPSQPMGAAAMFDAHDVGTVRTYINNKGVAFSSRVEAVSDSRVHVVSDSGCHNERDIKFLYWPDDKWWNCRNADSENTIELEAGQIWPLQVGNAWIITWKGESSKEEFWRNSAKCQVTGEARIQSPAGEHDAYKVVCNYPLASARKDRYQRVRYYAPDVNGVVAGSSYKNGELRSAFALEAFYAD